METKERPVSKFTSRLSYTFGAFGNDVFYAALSSYLIMFITSHLFNTGDKATNNRLISYVTLIIMILRIVELLIDPFIGNAIDRTKTRWGHFRPWVVVGGTISSVALLILFTNMGGLNKSNPWLYSLSLPYCISRWISSIPLKILVFGRCYRRFPLIHGNVKRSQR